MELSYGGMEPTWGGVGVCVGVCSVEHVEGVCGGCRFSSLRTLGSCRVDEAEV